MNQQLLIWKNGCKSNVIRRFRCKYFSHFPQSLMNFYQKLSVKFVFETFWSFWSDQMDRIIHILCDICKHKITSNHKSCSSLPSMTMHQHFFTFPYMHIHHTTVDKKFFDARIGHILPMEEVNWYSLRLKSIGVISKTYFHVLNSISAFLVFSWLLKIEDCF